MTFKNLRILTFCFLGLSLLLGSCVKEKKYDGIVLYQPTDPQSLNPMLVTDANARRMAERIFQPLLSVDYFTYDLLPVLVKERPIIKVEADGSSTMTMEIREEAIWDDVQTPITGFDVAFTLKVMKTPGVDNAPVRPYFDYINDVKVDESNPKKFTLICNEPYMIQESALTDLLIYPAHVYDEEGILEAYTVGQLSEGGEELAKDPQLQKFAEAFNSPSFRNKRIVGSNAYEFTEWITNERVVFTRKKSWWGDKVSDGNSWFDAFPSKITFRTINDPNTALVALKSKEIDVLYRMDPKAFVTELKQDSSFTADFHLGMPTQFIYSYIGLNMQHPKLSDVNTRKALRHLMDVESYSKDVFYGLAERVRTFIHPSKEKFIDQKIPYVEYNIEKAIELLKKAGWEDANNDGILDKMIDGKRTNLSLELFYPNMAKTSEKGVLIFQQSCKKAGVEIIPSPQDFQVMIDKVKKHEFETYFGLWGSAPVESDPTQLWHTNSQNGGSNYVYFGNAESDAVIEKLTRELNEDKRAEYYKQLERMIDDQAPYIFIMSTKNRVAISKKATNPRFSGLDPGFWTPGLITENVSAN